MPSLPRLPAIALLVCQLSSAFRGCGSVAQPERLACEASGYCSLGKVQPWAGDVDSAQGLKAALHARSFKNEIVLTAFGYGWEDTALQLAASMRRVGLAHLLALTGPPPSGCIDLLQAMPALGCGFSSSLLHEPAALSPTGRLYFFRHSVAARAEDSYCA